MTIYTNTYIPYEFDTRRDCLNYIIERCQGLKKSLRFIEMDNEHLVVRCPLSGDYLDVVGTVQDLVWINSELIRLQWYRTN